MPITIDQESRKFSRMPTNIDFMTDTYRTDTNIFSFPSPDLWTIEKNLFFLLRNSKEKQFEQKYVMRPDYLSFDEYKTVILANLLMFVNNVKCIEQFNLDVVVIPTIQSIIEICSDKFSKKDIDEMFEVQW